MKRVVGLVLLILGLSWLLLSVLNFTITETVIDIAPVLEPGEEYGGYQKETTYGSWGPAVLTGNVSVEGEGIDFTVYGHGGIVKRIFVKDYFNFTIGPPHGDFYDFTFDNTYGNATSHVKFVLNETVTGSPTWRLMMWSWRSPNLWIYSLLGAFLSLPIGFILTFGSLLSKKKKRAE